MYKRLFKIALLFLISACTSNTIYEKPEDLIPRAQMIDLLTDLYIANATGNYPDKKGNRNVKYFPLIYEKYKIDSSRFKRSNQYYTSKVKEYQIISQSVLNNLEALKKEYEGPKKLLDSLDKIRRDSVKISTLKQKKSRLVPLKKGFKGKYKNTKK